MAMRRAPPLCASFSSAAAIAPLTSRITGLFPYPDGVAAVSADQIAVTRIRPHQHGAVGTGEARQVSDVDEGR